MKVFKLIITLALLVGLIYLAGTTEFKGKTVVDHIADYWHGSSVEKTVNKAGKEIKGDLEKRVEAVKPKKAKIAEKGGKLKNIRKKSKKSLPTQSNNISNKSAYFKISHHEGIPCYR